jgi:hypothetical protein
MSEFVLIQRIIVPAIPRLTVPSVRGVLQLMHSYPQKALALSCSYRRLPITWSVITTNLAFQILAPYILHSTQYTDKWTNLSEAHKWVVIS